MHLGNVRSSINIGTQTSAMARSGLGGASIFSDIVNLYTTTETNHTAIALAQANAQTAQAQAAAAAAAAAAQANAPAMNRQTMLIATGVLAVGSLIYLRGRRVKTRH